MGIPFVLILFIFPSSSSGDPLKSVETVQASGTISYFPKLKGINIFVDDWMTWSYNEIDQQMADVANAGFNFVRTGIFFTKFYDFATEQVNRSKGAWAYDQTVHFMNASKTNGLLVSVVAMETGELSQLQNEHWYSDSIYQSALQAYYYNFAKWCCQMGWSNIIYISVWWEASSADPWHDGLYSLQNSLPNFAEANNDWKSYCTEHNYTASDLSMTGSQPVQWRPTLWYYGNWSRQVFNEITQIKAEAVKQRFPGMLVGGEIGLVGDSYNADEWTPQFYLGAVENQSQYPNKVVIPSLCAESYVDVLELHDYFDSVQEVMLYLSYPTSKLRVMAEFGPSDYSTSGPDNLTSWWNIIEPKMDAFWHQANGFAYWDWKDYDARHLGLEDINFDPRPALTTISTWMKTL
jgi:hypothetical protein